MRYVWYHSLTDWLDPVFFLNATIISGPLKQSCRARRCIGYSHQYGNIPEGLLSLPPYSFSSLTCTVNSTHEEEGQEGEREDEQRKDRGMERARDRGEGKKGRPKGEKADPPHQRQLVLHQLKRNTDSA